MGECFMLHRVTQRIPKFTYTGSYQLIDDGGGNWRIKFKTSGTLTFQNLGNARKGIDVFLVGGGGSGAAYTNTISWQMKAGGGAGYTKTQKNVSVTKGTSYSIVIGAGGSGTTGTNPKYGKEGGDTSAFGYTAYGGNKTAAGEVTNQSRARSGYSDNSQYGNPSYGYARGGKGGSGGSVCGASSWPSDTVGGTNGGNGTGTGSYVGIENKTPGTGQGTTTKEFGESGGTLYATGGGYDTQTPVANSGNGGTGDGSSGIVVIRNHR